MDPVNVISFSSVQPQSSYVKKKIPVQETFTLRKACSQALAVMAVNVMSIALGTSAGFVRVIVPSLSERDSDIRATSSEITWISSILFFLTPVGYALSGPLTHYLGRRRTLLAMAIPYSLEWLFLYRANSAKTLMIALGAIGVTSGLIHSPITMYVAEISRPHLRGAFLVVCPLAMSFGMFVETLVGRYKDWRSVTLLNLAIPIVGFALLLLIPESPHWLASEAKLIEAERALCWLRGWTSPEEVKSEHRELAKMFPKRGFPSGVDESSLTPEEVMMPETCSSSLQHYKQRSFWLPFLLLTFVLAVKAFGGTIVVQTYVTVLFDWLSSPLDKNLATTLTGSLELVACAVGVLVIHYIGKRRLTILSLLVLSALHVLLAFYCYSVDEGTLEKAGNADFAVVLLMGVAFFSQLGIKMIPHILMGEVFPMKTRSYGVGAVNTFGYVMISVANKIFYQQVDRLKLSGSFLCFGVVNTLGCIVLYVFLPETEAKSLQEIEKQFATRIFYANPPTSKKGSRVTFKSDLNVPEPRSSFAK